MNMTWTLARRLSTLAHVRVLLVVLIYRRSMREVHPKLDTLKYKYRTNCSTLGDTRNSSSTFGSSGRTCSISSYSILWKTRIPSVTISSQNQIASKYRPSWHPIQIVWDVMMVCICICMMPKYVPHRQWAIGYGTPPNRHEHTLILHFTCPGLMLTTNTQISYLILASLLTMAYPPCTQILHNHFCTINIAFVPSASCNIHYIILTHWSLCMGYL